VINDHLEKLVRLTRLTRPLLKANNETQ
jgi:hypothetical protein